VTDGVLLDVVYSCAACGEGYGFERAASGGFFKFPPTIGATGRADLLFVGVNPRRSGTNIDLATAAMTSREAFQVLAGNREPDARGRAGARYLRRQGSERSPYRWEGHYAVHVEIVEAVWGRGSHFEDHAAVTELYLCSTLNTASGERQLHWDSPCASRYFGRIVAQIRPRVIVAVGAPPRDYLRSKSIRDETNPFRVQIQLDEEGSGGVHEAWVFVIHHPNGRGDPVLVREALAQAKAGIRRVLIDHATPVTQRADWPVLRSGATRRTAPRASRRESPVPAARSGAAEAQLTGTEDWWRRVLTTRAVPPRGALLASHPQSADFTRRLLANLTVARLVRIANVQHNYCGPKDLRVLSPHYRSRDAELAWRQLLKYSQIPQGGANGWTGAIKLLTPGSEAALPRARELKIGPLIALCAEIVEGPYRAANARGIR
jgi:hypothetical protein